MKNHTFVAIGVVALMISGQTLAAASPEPQSAQQQAMERLRQQQEQMREQQQERMREQQQEQMREQQQEQQQERLREQEQERQREQEQTRQREQQARSQAQPDIRTGYTPQNATPPTATPENHPYNNVRPESRQNLGVNHPNTTDVNPAMRHAMTYNTRPGGAHISPEYFATHYGRAHGFHFTNYAGGPCIGNCGLIVSRGEWYFYRNGGWFGLMGPMPGNWGLQTDYLYIDIGDDGNYYLYDAQFPDLAVQLTFVQKPGDDQAGADQDQGDQSGQ